MSIEQRARAEEIAWSWPTGTNGPPVKAVELGIIEGRRQAFEETAKVADSRALREGRYEKAGRVADEIATDIRALIEEEKV